MVFLLEYSMPRADDEMRQHGLDDFMFDRLQEEHAESLATFRRALARGDVSVVAERVEDWRNGHGI